MDQPQRGALWEQVGRGLAKAGCHGNSTTTTREAKGSFGTGQVLRGSFCSLFIAIIGKNVDRWTSGALLCVFFLQRLIESHPGPVMEALSFSL